MRQRLAIWFILPCLVLAGPSVPLVCGQVSGLLAPADPEAAGVRKDARTAAQAGAAQPAGQAPAPGKAPQPAAASKDDAPAVPAARVNIDKWNDAHSIFRLKHPSICWPKLLLVLLLILIWVRSADWVNRDTQIFNLSYGKWNPILLFPFLAILLLFTFPVIMIIGVANFWVAFGLLFVCYIACFIPYVLTRNKAVQLHQKVFTRRLVSLRVCPPGEQGRHQNGTRAQGRI